MTEPLERLQAALSGHYQVEREIGAGGMATVYLARDQRHNRPVAIKVLNPALLAAGSSRRFLTEVHVTANLQHPDILPLHDSGEVDGLVYYVMPFVEGESLRARLTRDGPLPHTEAIQLLIEIADALACAHERGVIHRDIKPENILLSRGHALIADFGVAKANDLRVGTLAWFDHRYADAETWLRKALELDSTFYAARTELPSILLALGRREEARKALPDPGDLRPGISESGWPSQVRVTLGDTAGARQALAAMLEMRRNRYVSPDVIAMARLALGDNEGAIAELERAVDEHAFTAVVLQTYRPFRALEHDPRYVKLVARMGLTPGT